MNRVSQLAAVLVLVGALLLAGPAFGFTTIAADRVVDVGTTDTEDALLGVAGTDETPDNQNDAVVMTITNNAGTDFESLETDVEIEDEDDNLAISDDFADQLAAGEETGLEVTCDGGGDGTATISVEATADGTGLGISDVTDEYTFDYSCTGGGTSPAGLDVGDVSTEDPEQRFTFDSSELGGSNDEATIELNPEGDDVEHVDLDDAAVTLVEGGGDVEIDGERITYTAGPGGEEGETVEIELSDFEIDGEPGDEGTVEYEDDERDDEDTFEVVGDDNGEVDIEFVKLTAEVTDVDEGPGINPDAPSEVEFEYETNEPLESGEIEFSAEVNGNEETETSTDQSGTVTIDLEPANQDGFPAIVAATIDGGEECEGEIEAEGESVEICD